MLESRKSFTPVHTGIAPLREDALNQLRVENLAEIVTDESKS